MQVLITKVSQVALHFPGCISVEHGARNLSSSTCNATDRIVTFLSQSKSPEAAA